jgi:TonB family protein
MTARLAPLVVVLLLVSAALASAQTVGGRVLDHASRLPARAVEVHVLGDSGEVLGSTATDTTGLFYVILKAPARVRLSFGIGGLPAFTTDTMTLAADDYVERSFLIELPRVYTELTVEKQVSMVPGTARLRYPPELKAAGVEGEVVATFVVDSTGRFLDRSFRVIRATDFRFADAVRAGLRTARFNPAMVGGQHVAQLVQQPFTFALTQ